jgi:hypothetical protein
MFKNMKIRVRILGILAAVYLLLLAMVLISAPTTHHRISEISSAILPAALRMPEAESAFERMKCTMGMPFSCRRRPPSLPPERMPRTRHSML